MKRNTVTGLIGIAFLLQGLLTTPAEAQPGADIQRVPQSVVNDLLRNDSQDFFQRGKVSFEQQVRDLQERQANPPGEVLQVNPELTPTLKRQLNELSTRTHRFPAENQLK